VILDHSCLRASSPFLLRLAQQLSRCSPWVPPPAAPPLRAAPVCLQDNLSRGNYGAVRVLERLAPPQRLQFVQADLGDLAAVERLFARNHFDAVMHFAAVAFVGESVESPLQYYHNITANTLTVLEAMKRHGVRQLIYSSTCATYGEPEVMPITEDTPQVSHTAQGRGKREGQGGAEGGGLNSYHCTIRSGT
jgi:UDP-glucose 4-epimerase